MEEKSRDMELPFAEPLPEAELALAAVRKAGEAILEVYRKDFAVMSKGEDNPLTEADLRSDKILHEELAKSGHFILSEEEEDNLERLKKDKLWIVDPLDGTKEFTQKVDEFSIMVGLVEKGMPVLGVVYQPTAGILYMAQKGQGVYELKIEGWVRLGGSRIKEMSLARAITSRTHFSEHDKGFVEFLGVSKFFPKGSSGLKTGEICKGEADFYFNSSDKLKQWDTCAAYCMIKEVGGRITNMLGEELEYNISEVNHLKGVLVTNGGLHEEIVRMYKEYLKQKGK